MQDLRCHLCACTPAESDLEGNTAGLTLPQTRHQEDAAPSLAETRKHRRHQLEEGPDQGEEMQAGNGSAKQLLAAVNRT